MAISCLTHRCFHSHWYFIFRFETHGYTILTSRKLRHNLLTFTILSLSYRSEPGGVRTLIALHHGRKTKSELFASCRGRENISGGSKIAWINVECNEDSLSQFLPKLESVGRPARLLLFPRDKFVVRRQLKRFRKNRNCSLAQESIHLAAVTLTADGCVNNIKFTSYLTRNRPLTYKRITKRQRPSNTRTTFHIMHLKA